MLEIYRGPAMPIEAMARLALKRKGMDDTLSVERNAFGKPYFPDRPELYFNGSHSENTALIAFSDVPVGIDLQFIDESKNVTALASRFFSPLEADYIKKLSKERRTRAFYRIWAAKEALMKCLGRGFDLPMKDFCVILTPVVVEGEKRKNLRLQAVDAGKSFAAFVCLNLEEK